MIGESDYRRHLVTSRPASPGRDGELGPGRAIDPAVDAARSDTAILSATRDALERARVTLFVQPIVSLPNRRTRYYETYSRIRSLEGEMIGPERYLRVASEAGLIAAIDNNLLFRCVQLMRRLRQHERNYGFFCNVSPHTVGDSTFFPQFVEFLGSNAELAGDIVFEFTQADIEAHYDSIAASLGQLERLGYRFSLDQLVRYDVNFRALADRHFRFVKLNAKAMLELRASPEGRQRIDRLLREARNAGVAPIVEKIETERQLIELLDFPFPLGQGYLFGVPKESRVRE
jgi:cyclic-di-GMP phosphodiesterase TipF (flagellum assembly factor)